MTGPVRSGISRFFVWLLVLPIRGYKRWISPLLGHRCRFYPSCSSYAVEALKVHGPVKGLALAVWRLLRCGPWSEGGFDPVPPARKKSSRFFPWFTNLLRR